METQKDNDMFTIKRHQKQFRRDPGAPKGYNKSIIEDAFTFAGKDVSPQREKFYLSFLTPTCQHSIVEEIFYASGSLSKRL